MDNIEQFKNDKNKPADLEEKLDNLTDQLLNAFEGKDDIIWENGKPDKFREYYNIRDKNTCNAFENFLFLVRRVPFLQGADKK